MARQRGCGTRVVGGIYAEMDLGPNGLPVEAFLIDPPIPIDGPQLAGIVTPIGWTTVERGGLVHVVDWVGQTHYPTVPDFVEEVRTMGLSRRAPRTFDFARLTPESRLLTVHARAWVEGGPRDVPDYCPLVRLRGSWVHADAPPNDGPCLGACWLAVGPELQPAAVADPEDPARVEVPLPGGGSYTARNALAVAPDRFRPAIFGSWPALGRFVVVRDPSGSGAEEPATRALEAAGVSYTLVDE